MSDYCGCGSIANARCQCGTTVCSIHVYHPQTYYDTSLAVAARVHGERPDGPLFTALFDAWGVVPHLSCGSCYVRVIDEVASRYVRAFRDHSDATAETIASVLIANDSWATRYEFRASETIGQKTLRAAGYSVPWSHPAPLESAGRLYASRHGEPPELPILIDQVTRKKTLFGGEKQIKSVTTWGSIRAWPITATFSSEGYTDSVSVLVGASGVLVKPSISNPREGRYFLRDQDAASAKSALEGPFRPSPTPTPFYGSEGLALSVALTDVR